MYWFELIMLAGLALWSNIDLLERAEAVQEVAGRWSVLSYSLQLYIVTVIALVTGLGVWRISGQWFVGVAYFIFYLGICLCLSSKFSFQRSRMGPFLNATLISWRL